MAGTSMLEWLLDGLAAATVFDGWAVSKKLEVLFGSETGDASRDGMSGVVAAESMKLREIVVKSESFPELTEELDDETELRVLISG
jgi:hypothetical protein